MFIVENVSRDDQRIVPAVLTTAVAAAEAMAPTGPVLILIGRALERAAAEG